MAGVEVQAAAPAEVADGILAVDLVAVGHRAMALTRGAMAKIRPSFLKKWSLSTAHPKLSKADDVLASPHLSLWEISRAAWALALEKPVK